MNYFLGVDGGGTKTSVVVIDENLNVVFKNEYSSSNYLTTGDEMFVNMFLQVKVDIEKYFSNITTAFFGMAGYGESRIINTKIEGRIEEIFSPIQCIIKNDSFAAWAGSLLCANGINVICGTGSITSGVNNGMFERVGGWSYLIGDEASGYWIGIKTMNAYSKMFDGRIEKDILYDVINLEYNLNDDLNFFELIYNKLEGNRTKIAQISKACAVAASKGSKVANDILLEAAKEVCQSVNAVAKKMNFEEPINISYAGGVFNSDIFRNNFIEELNTLPYTFNMVTPITIPSYGASLYAYYLSGNELTEDVLNKYKMNIS